MPFRSVSSTHTLTCDIPADPDVVRDYYADLRNTVEVHPLVASVTLVETRRTSAGECGVYRITDRIPLGPFAFTVGYDATVTVPESGPLHTEAHRFPAIRLTGFVAFDSAEAGTRLTERVTVSAPRPLATYTVRQALNAHTTMLDGIRGHFELA